MNILAIDDDVDFADAVILTLESAGHQITMTRNWLSFMRELNRHDFDAIIADVETPTGNGLTAIAFLNEEEKVRRIPKLFVTGRRDDETIQKCIGLDATYMHKSPGVFEQIKGFLDSLTENEPANLEMA